jgi:hypothetical protein
MHSIDAATTPKGAGGSSYFIVLAARKPAGIDTVDAGTVLVCLDREMNLRLLLDRASAGLKPTYV